MIEIVPLKARHVLALELQPEQADIRARLTADYLAALEANRSATALIDGKPVACAGLAAMDGLTFAWALMGVDAGRAMLAATRACEAMLAREAVVHAHVRPGYDAGARWLTRLGFGPAQGVVDVDGRNFELWVRRNA